MKTSLKLLLAVVPTLLLAACGGGSDDNFDDRVGLAEPKIRLVHAIPLAPNISLYRNGMLVTPELTNLPYKGATNYLNIDNTSELWSVRTETTPFTEVGSVTFNADRGHKYTLIAISGTNPTTTLQMIDDPYNKGIVSDNARVRVFHAALNAAGVDVYLTGTTTDIATVNPTFAAVGYKQALPATGSDSLEVEGGGYMLRITAAGTKTVMFKAPVDLAKNADWLLMPVPASVTPNDLKVLVVQTDSSTPAQELSNTP